MKRASYGEHDYGFGQQMLTLRMAIGLTQTGLADLLGVSRHAVGGWEAGRSYPKVEHLKAFIELALQQHIFAPGSEAHEIRALWHAAHQKVGLDELWLHKLLDQQVSPLEARPVEQTHDADAVSTPPATNVPRVDWGDALDVPTFYGRERELALLFRWIAEERCRVVSVLGMGGIGKSALTVTLMRQVATRFEVVIWRSLRDAPACDALLNECLQVLAPQSLRDRPNSFEGWLQLFMKQMRERRVLLVLDNLEMLLEEGTGTGRMRVGFEGYTQLLRYMGETMHQSCLLLTSREKPVELVPLEGNRSPVRTIRLAGLDVDAGVQLLAEKDVVSSPTDWARLVEAYRGNPLALKIVAQTIVELFGGEIALFLKQGEMVFGGVSELLREQFDRLSALEQSVLLWLAILREPVSLEQLLAVLNTLQAPVQALEAIDGLRRRSLIEQGQRVGSFTLQSVVLEYATTRLIIEASHEIERGHLVLLIEHGLYLARVKEYVRQAQKHLIVIPLLTRLQSRFQEYVNVEERLLWMLDHLRSKDQKSQGYGPANVISLLKELHGNLRSLDLSRLFIRGAYLQGVEMQDTSLEGARLDQVMFTEAFDAVRAVAISPDGRDWAAGSNSGEIRIWREEGYMAHTVIRAHTNTVPTIVFSPNGQTLASGSWDCTVKLWDVASKALLWNFQEHRGYVQSIAFRPDGNLLASGSDDGSVKLWDLSSGRCLRTLRGHKENVYSVAWHPNGRILASGSFDQMIRIWDVESGECVQILSGHTHWVMVVAFTPDGTLLASGGADHMVKLWEVESGRCQQTLSGHTSLVNTMVWSPNGDTLVSGSYDTTIRLWHLRSEMIQQTLLGHTDIVRSIAFTPDGKQLLSGSEDRTLQVWEISSGQCLRVLQGYWVTLYALDWSPDNRFLASGGTDCTVTIWDSASKRPVKRLQGHTQAIYTLAWHPNGRLLATGGYDQTVCIWESTTGEMVQLLRAHTSQVTRVAWSPDGAWLASTSYDQVVRVWDVSNGSSRWVGRAHTSLISAVCWSPDGTRLATCGDDHTVRIWQAEDGMLLHTLQGHSKDVASVAWSPDGKIVASCGGGGSNGELFLWDAESWQLLSSLVGHSSHIFPIAWSPQGDILVSAGIDGTIRWWDVKSGVCLYARQGHQAWINSLAINPNGDMLASCGYDGVIHLWEMQSFAYIATLRSDRPYERLAIGRIIGLNEAEKTTLRALGAIEV